MTYDQVSYIHAVLEQQACTLISIFVYMKLYKEGCLKVSGCWSFNYGAKNTSLSRLQCLIDA